ncbi:MAG: BglG family transcription antiterminator [Mycoplasmatales bacterium]
MISERMLNVIKFLEVNNLATIKEVSKNQNISERIVRYDIERINEILFFNKLPLVEKKAKGVLYLPEGINHVLLSNLSKNFFVKEERCEIIELLLLLAPEKLKLNKLSEHLNVSRSTIKNDLNMLQQSLSVSDLKIVYRKNFLLEGPMDIKKELFIRKIIKHTHLLKKGTVQNLSKLDKEILQIIESSFAFIDLRAILNWLERYLAEQNKFFSDYAFKSYYAFVLFFLKERNLNKNTLSPEEESALGFLKVAEKSNAFLSELEVLVGGTFSEQEKKQLLFNLNGATNQELKMQEHEESLAQAIVADFITLVEKRMNITLRYDTELIEELYQLIKEVRTRTTKITIDANYTLTETELNYLEDVKHVVSEIPEICDKLDEIDLLYITMKLVFKIRKQEATIKKQVLFICSFGEGISRLISGKLKEEFNIEISTTSPLHIDSKIEDLAVHCIITTKKIELKTKLPVIEINPILTIENLQELEKVGLIRKTTVQSRPEYLEKKIKLKSFFSKENLFFVEELTNSKEIITQLLNGKLTKEQVESALYTTRNEKFGVIYTKAGLNQSEKICIVKSEKSIMMADSQKIQNVFVVITKESTTFIQLLIMLNHICDDPKLFEQIFKQTSPTELIEQLVRVCEKFDM